MNVERFFLTITLLVPCCISSILATETAIESSRQDVGALTECAVSRYLKFRRQLEQSTSDSIVIPYVDCFGTALGTIWVANYPAEWLCWEEVLQPLAARGYVPDFVSGFKPTAGHVGDVTIIVEYDRDYLHTRAGDHISCSPTCLEIDGFSAFLAEGNKQVWIRNQLADLDSPRVCLIVKQHVSRNSDGRTGILHAVETLTLIRRPESREFAWKRSDSDFRFVPDTDSDSAVHLFNLFNTGESTGTAGSGGDAEASGPGGGGGESR